MSKLVNLNTLLNIDTDEVIAPTKVCLYCEKRKLLSEYPKHSHHKDRHDTRCRACIKKQSSLRQKLHSAAPAKPKVCECCGKKPKKWCLDHDHDTDLFRGWLCDACNVGIGKLGDDIDGVLRAVKYLQSKKSNN